MPKEIDPALREFEGPQVRCRTWGPWASVGNLLYPITYGLESLKLDVAVGNYGCANWFEFDAGLHEGKYGDC